MTMKTELEKLLEVKNEKGEIVGSLGNLEYIKYGGAFLTKEKLLEKIKEYDSTKRLEPNG